MRDGRKMTAREQEIEGIVKGITEGYKPLKVTHYGSHAWGQPTDDGDIDLLIVKETSEGLIDRWATGRELIADPERRNPVEPIAVTLEESDRRITEGDQFSQEMVARGKPRYAA